MHSFLAEQKNNISKYYQNKKWDKYKKFANDYELVFTSCFGFQSISSYSSISRSFFKLWEILWDFNLFKVEKNVKAAFIAEGPGGFIEAFTKYRKMVSKKKDTIYGLTLLSENKSVPSWKIPQHVYNDFNINLLVGKDGTGSIYNLENIENFVETIGSHTCELVTGDGGFDFSTNFNNQEEQSTFLIICEVFIALKVQKKGGTFVLKIYDISTMLMIQLLEMLNSVYSETYIVKPLSSRPANSEKYLVCNGFKLSNKVEHILMQLKNIVEAKEVSFNNKVPSWFLGEIVYFNVFFISRQVVNINKTLSLITQEKDTHDIIKNIRIQLHKAIRWCNKYKIPVSLSVLQKYREYYYK